MSRRPPRSTGADLRFPYTTLFWSAAAIFAYVLGQGADIGRGVLRPPLRGRIAALGPRRRVGAGWPDATLRAQAFDRIGAGVHGLDPPAWDAAFGDQHRLAGLDRGQHLGGLVDRKSTRLNSSH